MPRFSANLGHLFVEYPLIERIGAAANAGFKAIELQLPYELAPSAVKAEIDKHRLTILNINTPQGPGGEPGLAAVAGREKDFAALFSRALDYVVAIGARRSMCCRASCRRTSAPRPKRCWSRTSRAPPTRRLRNTSF